MAGGAEAQQNCTAVPKQKLTTVQTSTCKVLPKDVCKISADRRSVTCYKTVNMETLEPWGNTMTYYGPTGPVPGGKASFETKTYIIKGQPIKHTCARNNEEKSTTCYIPGYRLYRDPQGYWGYQPDPEHNTLTGNTDNYNTGTNVVYK